MIKKYGDAKEGGLIVHKNYPDNFSAEQETTIQQIVSLADDPKLKVMRTMNEKLNSWKMEDGLGYALYGTPAESLCYRFAKKDLERFGEIKKMCIRDSPGSSYANLCDICNFLQKHFSYCGLRSCNSS